MKTLRAILLAFSLAGCGSSVMGYFPPDGGEAKDAQVDAPAATDELDASLGVSDASTQADAASSCYTEWWYSVADFNVDLDGDDIPDHAFLVNTGHDYDTTSNKNGNNHLDYHLYLRLGKEDGCFGYPRVLHRFYRQPTSIGFDDINDDDKPDLVYLIKTHDDTDNNGDGENHIMQHFELAYRANDGHANFAPPTRIKKFPGGPVKIPK